MRVEILNGAERRPRWSDDKKGRIIEESIAPGAKASARRFSEPDLRLAAPGELMHSTSWPTQQRSISIRPLFLSARAEDCGFCAGGAETGRGPDFSPSKAKTSPRLAMIASTFGAGVLRRFGRGSAANGVSLCSQEPENPHRGSRRLRNGLPFPNDACRTLRVFIRAIARHGVIAIGGFILDVRVGENSLEPAQRLATQE